MIFYPNSDDANGKVSIGISKKAPAGGSSGSGVIVDVEFLVDSNTPNGTTINFSFVNITANNPSGTQIILSPSGCTVTITSGLTVWSGDTNNNGVVNQADVLPIGLYWNKTGTARNCHTSETQWIAHTAVQWNPSVATYADADGNGVVNQADILPIGVNWTRTHSYIINHTDIEQNTLKTLNNPALRPVAPTTINSNQEFYVDIIIADNMTPCSNLFGISFVLDYSSSKNVVQAIEAVQGTFLGNDIIFFPQLDNNNGTVSCGITRKAGQGGANGTGILARIKMKIINPTTNTVSFITRDIIANDPDGKPIIIDSGNSNVLVDVEQNQHIPVDFVLFQNFPNPFNPSTTIKYELPERSFVELTLYDLLGREIKTLLNEEKEAGYHELQFNAENLSSGVYLYRIQAGNFTQTKKMVVLK